MRHLHTLLLTLILTMTATASRADATEGSIIINLSTNYRVLPPDMGTYKSDPGRFFTVSVTNTSTEIQNVYFGLQLEYLYDEHGMATNALAFSTPTERPTRVPYIIQPGVNTLTKEDLRRLFNHIPTSELHLNEDFLGKLGLHGFGLLPEGTYRARLTAYKWDTNLILPNGKVQNPIPVSDPMIGTVEFDVCYRAQAPQFTTPTSFGGTTMSLFDLDAVKVSTDNPVFAWTEPMLNCASYGTPQYSYRLEIKEIIRNEKSVALQTPERALVENPVFLAVSPLSAPQAILRYDQVKRLKEGHLYVAQVTATPRGNYAAYDPNYSIVDNGGKSDYIVFTPDTSNGLPTIDGKDKSGSDDDEDDEDDDDDDSDDDDDGDEEDEEEDDLDLELLGVEYIIGDDDAKYVMQNPKLVKPDFTGTNNVVLGGNNIDSEWERPVYIGGEGQEPDTLKIRYRAKIWTITGYPSVEEALQQEPIYDQYVKGKQPETTGAEKPLPKPGELPESDVETAVDVLQDYILWPEVEKYVSMNEVLMLRITAECVNEKSVRFANDDINSVLFMYSDKLSDAFGDNCEGGIIMNNRVPIDCTDTQMQGKTIFVGEYTMVMNEDVKQNKSDHTWSGTAWMTWHNDITTQELKIGVEFEGISINSDYIMYDGKVRSQEAEMWKGLTDDVKKGMDDAHTEDLIPDDVFSDWGLDNLWTSMPDIIASTKDKAGEKVNGVAQRIKATKYYDYIQKGCDFISAIENDKLNVDLTKIYLPLKVPESINPTPVDIAVISMEWEPTRAFMNLMGMTKLPDSEYTDENVLVFGAPRLCMDPQKFLPGYGNVVLMEDLTVNDPNSDFKIKFVSPTDKKDPKDGCRVHWENGGKNTVFALKADIDIPDLVKCDDQGKASPTGEVPTIHLETEVTDWEDLLVDVSIDPFTHEDILGWTFVATNVTLDLSRGKNQSGMTFPGLYKKDFFMVEGAKSDNDWKGLYIKDISVMFPEGFIKNGDDRLKIEATNMLIDKSGVTCNVGFNKVVNASIDDWALRIKDISINILQNDFNGCGMSGDIHVPLTEDDDYIAFSCDMIPVRHSHKKYTSDNPNPIEEKTTTFDFLLKVQPTKDGTNPLDGKLKFDFWLATLKLANKQTYFLLEAIDQGKGLGYDTKVELCMAGELSIGGETVNGWIQEQLNKLPLKVEMPGIHFTQMRLSNRERSEQWVYGEAVRKAAEDAYKASNESTLKVLGKNKTIKLGSPDSPCYFDCGNWSVASGPKKIGPFSFSITDFDYGKIEGCDSVYVQATGEIGFISNGSSEPIVTAGTSLRLNAEVNIKQKKLKYAGIKFLGCSLDIKTAGMRIYGKLDLGGYGAEGSDDHDNGYNGELEFTMPGDLFTVSAAGGYYEHKAMGSGSDKDYSWGYFKAMMDSKAGIHADPLVINRIAGGFYFNCRPTKDDTNPNDKFGGAPERLHGAIGIALGMTLSTSAGEDALKSDVDLLVVYNRDTKRLSTFLFNGKLEAVGGIVKADVSLIYEHTTKEQSKVEEGPVATQDAPKVETKDRYLCLNVTVEYGLDSDKLKEQIAGANADLLDVKNKMNEFQANLDKVDLNSLGKEAPMQGLNQLSGDYEKNADGVAEEGDEDTSGTKKKGDDFESFSAGQTKIAMEFMITWAKDGVLPTPKWHLYVGEPAKDKRCTYTYLKFKSSICTVDIGADGYLCLGNELPGNGALPEIPAKIVEFLQGHQQEGRDFGADMQKVERSRAKAAKAMLDPTSMKGGVMVGASCWGDINIDLGLIYGSLESMAGFDASLINYGSNAFCVNSHSSMGKNGWYALGQLYAYLAAKLGVHIKIGKLINKHVALINAGVGGVLELGLPNPSWLEGQIRVKMSFLGGLFKLNKKFDFAAGDHCVPFRGNALDGFELFQGVSLGSDSIYEALYQPEFAITKQEAQQMTFTTNSSLGSHYRLVDPSYSEQIAEDTGEDASKLNLHASRTYVFDIDHNLNMFGMKMGVRLFDLGEKPTELANGNKKLSPAEFHSEMGATDNSIWALLDRIRKGQKYNDFTQFLVSGFQKKENTVIETSYKMKGKELDKGRDELLDGAEINNYIEQVMDQGALLNSKPTEVNVSVREDKGTVFHLTGMNDLKPGHSYALVLMGNAYEIDNGKRVWCEYFDESSGKDVRIQWKQSKLWFFRIKNDAEDVVVGDSINDLTPYVALAYPSVDGTKVKSGSEGYTTAYFDDIMKPTIALKRDLSTELPEGEKLKWRLTTYRENEYSEEHPEKYLSQETVAAKYYTSNKGNCVNLEPEKAFTGTGVFATDAINARNSGKSYDFGNELYHLQLLHTYYNVKAKKDSTVALVDLWLTGAPHGVTVKGVRYNDNWLKTTSSGVTGKLLPYVEPFVGARPWSNPTIAYVDDEKKLTDQQVVFDNSKKYDGKPFRLIDPYLYLAYLSKWAFIGDRTINSYAWDDAQIPFGSESLIFERNGTVVNTEFFKNQNNPSVYDYRTRMYNTWNDWYYNNPNMPEYPLPITLGTVGGPTVANQDNRASTITPLNVNHYDNQSYNIADLVEDFSAAYVVADMMCRRLKSCAYQLFDEFTYDIGDTDVNYNLLDSEILKWNKLHRGQYLEVEHRGTKARVPYYQLPLLFGDCFAGNSSGASYFDGIKLDKKNRDFGTTIGSKDMTDPSRYNSACSNLLFFRLLGPEQFANYTAQAFLRYKAGEHDNCYLNPASSDDANLVAWDQFDVSTALKAVTDFTASIYRVDAYDIDKGMYVVDGRRGGGPWTEDVSINASSSIAKNMDEMFSQVNDYREFLDTHHDTPQPQAIYTKEDRAMTFLYSDKKYNINDKLNGNTIWEVWSGEDFTSLRWQNIPLSKYEMAQYFDEVYVPSHVQTVRIDESFAKADIRSTGKWFYNFTGLKTITGLKNLNTSNVTEMSGMFGNCTQLENLDVSSFDTHNVTRMASMFYGCSSLINLDVSEFKTNQLEDTRSMFGNCKALTTLNMKTFKASKAKNSSGMFEGCKNLSTLYMNDFSPEEVSECGLMFREVPSTVKVYYPYDLDERIKSQIPGIKYEQGNPVKAIYATDSLGQNILLFINTLKNIKTGSTDTITGKNTIYSGMKVNQVWTANTVLNTATSVPWSSYAEKVTKVIFDASFKDSPKSLKDWFKNFSNLKSIEGLENLNTKKTTDMSYMFCKCGQLTSLDVSHFNWENVTTTTHMFDGCAGVTELQIFSHNSKKVEDASYMFASMSNLTYVDPFNTISVKNMTAMFKDCKKLKKIDRWIDVSNATTLRQMFEGCEQLEVFAMNLSEAAHVGDMAYMFSGCKKLNGKLSEAVKRLTALRVENIKAMFKNCAAVEKLDLTSFETLNVTNFSELFSGCISLKELNLCNMTTPKVTACTDMFKSVPTNCTIYLRSDVKSSIHPTQVKKATHPNLILIYPAQVLKVQDDSGYTLVFLSSNNVYGVGGKWNGYTITEVWSGMDVIRSYEEDAYLMSSSTTDYRPKWVGIAGDGTITKVIFDPSFAQISPLSTSCWLYGFSALTSIEGLEYLDLSNVKTMSGMFSGCASLTKIPQLSKLNTSNVENMSGLFSRCISLTEVDLSGLNTSNVTSLAGMFSNCQSLTSVDLSSLDISNVTDVGSMFSVDFYGESKLKSIKMPKTTSEKITNMSSMFANCRALPEVDLSCFKAANLETVGNMFSSCSSLKKLTLGDTFNVGKLGYGGGSGTFYGVHDLMIYTTAENLALMRREFTEKLGFIEGDTGWFYEEGLKDDRPKVAQAIWTNDNKTLTFYYGPQCEKGKTFGGNVITNVWSGVDVTNTQLKQEGSNNSIPWTSACNDIYFVVFDPSFAEVRPQSNIFWFKGFANLENIVGIEHLNTSESTTMRAMFSGCEDLETLDVSGFKTEKVKNISAMFYGCSSLSSLDLTSFDTRAVTNTNFLFSNDSKLANLQVGSNFTFDKITSKASSVFYNVKNLSVTVNPKSSTNTIRDVLVNKLGFVEGTNGDLSEIQVVWTARNSTLTFMKGSHLEPDDLYNKYNVTKVWYEDDVLSATGGKGDFWRATDICEKVKTVVFDKSFADVRPKSTAYWFYNFTALQKITNLTYLNTSEVENMNYMFCNCSSLKSINASKFDTRKVTSMAGMFDLCTSLTSLDISSFNTSSLRDATCMFLRCWNLPSLDLSHFNTSEITKAEMMFYEALIPKLILGPECTFDKLSISNADRAFYNISKLNVVLSQPSQMENVKTAFTEKLGFIVGTNGRFVEPGTEVVQAVWTADNTTLTFMLDYPYKEGDTFNKQKVTKVWTGKDVANSPTTYAPKWTSTVSGKLTKVVFDKSFESVQPTSMRAWFVNCSKLTTLSNTMYLNTSKVTTMFALFSGCKSLTNASALKSFNTSNVTDMASMFKNCSALTSVDFSSFNTGKVTSMKEMFSDCSSLTSLSLDKFKTENVTNMASMFLNCSKLTSLSTSDFKTHNVTDMSNMFKGCSSLTTMNLSHFSPSSVKDMSGMFMDCSNLTSVTINKSGGSYAENLKNTTSMFENCKKLETMYFYNSSKSGKSMDDTHKMFYECNELTDIILNLRPSGDASLSFYNCYKLKKLEATKEISMIYARNVSNMYYRCESLERLDIAGECSNATDWSWMFYGCKKLKELTIGPRFNPSSAKYYSNVFGNINNNQIRVYVRSTDNNVFEEIKGYVKKLGFIEGTTGYFEH